MGSLPKKPAVLLAVFGIVSILNGCHGSAFISCMVDDDESPNFSVSPGVYEPSQVIADPTVCAKECGYLLLPFAAVWKGNLCFCSNTLTGMINSTDSDCTGDQLVKVYYATDFNYTSSVQVGIQGGETVADVGISKTISLTTSLNGFSGMSVRSLAYGDDPFRSEIIPDGALYTHTYLAPGAYSLQGKILEEGSRNTLGEGVSQVLVTETAVNADLNLTCVDRVAINQEAVCNLEIAKGTHLQATIAYGSEFTETVTVPFTPWDYAGRPVANHPTDIVSSSLTGFHLVDAEFRRVGTVDRLAYYAASAGTLFRVHDCTGGNPFFCYSSNTCGSAATCSNNIDCTGKTFCPVTSNCYNSCSGRFNDIMNTTAVSNDLIVNQIMTHTAATAGYQIITLGTPWEVQVGDRLGFHVITAGVVAARTRTKGENNDFRHTSVAAPTVGIVLTKAGFSTVNVQHQLAGAARPKNNFTIIYKFTQIGNQSVTFTAKNWAKPLDPAAVATAYISVEPDINDTRLHHPIFWPTNESVEFFIFAHTGLNVDYFWSFGDGNTLNTTNSSVKHIYATKGVYSINVTSFNPLDAERNFSSITIQDRVVLTNLTTPSGITGLVTQSTIELAGGSDYQCNWTIDGFPTVTTAFGVLSYNHTYTSLGNYSVTVICFNGASNSSLISFQMISEKITGLRFLTTGAVINEDVPILFTLDTGSDVTFELLINNLTTTFNYNPVTKIGASANVRFNSAMMVVGVVRAYNTLGDVISVCNITFDEKIVNPSVVALPAFAEMNQTIRFVVSMDAGSSVKVEFQYGDGDNFTYESPTLESWPANYNVNKSFSISGPHDVVAIISNGAGNFTITTRVNIIALLGDYTLKAVTPFVKVGQVGQVQLVRTSGGPAALTNLTINWSDNTPDTSLSWTTFNETGIHSHLFSTIGSFNVSALLVNPLPRKSFASVLINVINQVEGLTCQFLPENVKVNEGFTVTTKLTLGELVYINMTSSEGSASSSHHIPSVVPGTASDSHTFNHQFPTVGNNTVFITACNQINCLNCSHIFQTLYPLTNAAKAVTNGYASDPPGLVNFTLSWTGSASAFPTSAIYTIDFKDGIAAMTGEFRSDNTPLVISKKMQPGLRVVDVVFSNLVSTYTQPMEVGSFVPFINFDVSIVYGADESPGFGVNKDKYPMNTPLIFKTNQTIGTVVWYIASYQQFQNTSIIYACNVTAINNAFNLTFTEIGDYEVTIMAWNPLSNGTVVKNITIGGSIKGLTINPGPTSWKPNIKNTFFVEFEVISEDTCICVNINNTEFLIYGATSGCVRCPDYNYTNIIPINNKIPIERRFLNPGDLTVTVLAYNQFQNATSQFLFPVSNADCMSPVLTMKLTAHSTPENPRIVKKSLDVTTEGIITDLPCVLTLRNNKSWIVEELEEETLLVKREVNISHIYSKNNTLFTLPAKTLTYGIYRLTFTVTMDKRITRETFRSSLSTYLKIIPSEIRVHIISGNMQAITRSRLEEICFDANKASYDPDQLDRNGPQFITNWKWYCWGKAEPEAMIYNHTTFPKRANYTFMASRTGCFGDGPGEINTTSSKFCFHGSNMVADQRYYLMVSGSKGNRLGQSRIDLLIKAGRPVTITVSCVRNISCGIMDTGPYRFMEQLINPSSSLGLQATCVGPTCDIIEHYNWTILVRNETNGIWTDICENTTAKYITGMKTKQIVILPGLFASFPNVLRYRTCFRAGSGDDQGSSCLQFYANKLPQPGNCSVDRTTITTQDRICATCTGFQDDMGIEQYQFFVKQGDLIQTLGYTINGNFCTIVPSKDYIQPFCTFVYNLKKGYIEFCFANLTVKQENITDIEKQFDTIMANVTSSLDKVIARGNLFDMSEIFIKTATYLKYYSKRDIQSKTSSSTTSRAGTGFTEDTIGEGAAVDTMQPKEKEAYEINRDKRSQLLKVLSNNLNNMMTDDIDSLQIVAGTTDSVADNLDDLSRDSQVKVISKLDFMSKDLERLQETGSKERLVEISKSLINGVWNTMTASNIQILGPINSDFSEAEEQMYYDTDLDSSEESFMQNENVNSAVSGLKLETNVNIQSGVAGSVSGNLGAQALSRCRKVLADLMVIGDNPLKFKNPQGAFHMEKKIANSFTNRTLTPGRAAITLPDICESLKAAGRSCTGDDSVVTLDVMANPTNVYSYMPTSNSKGLPVHVDSEIVSISFIGVNNKELEVKNISVPIVIFLPKDPSFQPEDFGPADPVNGKPQLKAPKRLPGTGSLFGGGNEFIYQDLFMHMFELTGSDQSIHFQMRLANFTGSCTQFLVVARFFDKPDLAKGGNFTFWGMIPSNTKYCYTKASEDEPDPWTFFVNNVRFEEAKRLALLDAPSWSKVKNKIFFGVREMRTEEWNTYNETTAPPIPYPHHDQLNSSYELRIFSAGCYHVSPGRNSAWNTSGCIVGPLTTVKRTQCSCNHLTSFSGGWITAPNTIDYDYVFANFDFSKNPTLYATEISIAVVFILIMVWARYRDRKDIEKLGVTPMADNDAMDLYLYEITIDTGMRNGASTDSNIFFTLSGEMDETDSRALSDPKRKILQRGSSNRFLMAVPRPLGNLQYVRIWHDNSGKGQAASWYCNYFGVLDLQTREKFHFIVKRWFAVEEDDGMIDRLVPVAGMEELLEFGEMFSRKMKKDLTEDHLWLSVMTRPPESRFTRLERVGCCLLLLFLTMVTTCMFYQKEGPAKQGSHVLTIGPFALTPEEVFIGIITNLITFFPLLLVMELFRRSQLHHGHANKLRKVVEGHLETDQALASEQRLTKMAKYRKQQSRMHSRPQTSSDGNRPIKTPCGTNQVEMTTFNSQHGGHNSRNTNTTDSSTTPSHSTASSTVNILSLSTESLPRPPTQNKSMRKRLFPWWVRIISWIILAIGVAVSALFTTFYGIMFGDIACKKWISSMFISFFASVLLTQPIKVVLLAVFFSLLCKKPGQLDDGEFEDEEEVLMNELGQKNGLFYDEEYLHSETMTGPTKPHKAKYLPPNEEDLERAREYRLNELKMFDVLREILFYIIFFCVLLLVTYSFRDPNAYYLKEEMTKLFMRNPDPKLPFEAIRSEDHFWNWTDTILVPSLRAAKWYNNDPPVFQRGFVSNRANRLIGYATMRQLRIQNGTCKVNSNIRHMVTYCHDSYSLFKEETGSFGARWATLNVNNSAEEFVYATASSLDGYPYIGRIGTYSGGGYLHQFKGSISALKKNVKTLRENRWIDEKTRAIFVEFTTYNPNINLFAINTILFEMPGTGGIWPSYRIEPAALLSFLASDVKAFEIFCYALFFIFIIVMIVKEVRKMIRLRRKYLNDPWNWCEIFIIGASIASTAVYCYVIISTSTLTEQFKKTNGNTYMKFQYVGFWNEYLAYTTAFIVFAATLKFIQLLRFNRRIGMLGAVLKYSRKDMGQFFILFGLIFIAFCIVFYCLFMDSLYRYHTFLHSTESSMQIALGKFEFLELYQKEPILGPIVFAAYVIFIIFVMLNMFVAILNDAFSKVRADVELQSNEFELVSFITNKFILWTGISQTKIGSKILKSNVAEQAYREHDSRELANKISNFSTKVDQLIDYINTVYLDPSTSTVASAKMATTKPPPEFTRDSKPSTATGQRRKSKKVSITPLDDPRSNLDF